MRTNRATPTIAGFGRKQAGGPGVFSARGKKDASGFAVPTIRAFVPEVWKKMELEIKWGFDEKRAKLPYDGRLEAYDGIIDDLRSLSEDEGTTVIGSNSWRSLNP
jgi:hypothetical protein